MPWTPLSDRWNAVPHILAGPILRRVEANLVSVWVATKASYEIELLVFDDAGNVLFTGTRRNVHVGAGCFIVVVTARPPANQPLRPGQTYRYNVALTEALHLKTPGVVAAGAYALPGEGMSRLGYGADDALPSFSLPPADPAKLRIIHSSCRRIHGEDRDALEGLDALIHDSAADPNARPHHLFLTGDQLYCDDVPEALLYEFIQANSVLFGTQEEIPGPNVTAGQLPPGTRDEVLLTAGGNKYAEYAWQRAHVLALSEFVSHYLYTWSDVLWPARGNWADQATARAPGATPGSPPPKSGWAIPGLGRAALATEYKQAIERMEYMRDGMAAARRALANVPTYMTFDDHDFTDSWSIGCGWTTDLLASPFGARHLRNALAAYALCQGWGNRPDDFEPSRPGAALFDAIKVWVTTGGLDLQAEATLHSLLGPNAPQQLADQTYELKPPQPATQLRWDWVITFPTHRLISLDGRTRCAFPDAAEGLVGIVAPAAIADQLPVIDNPPPISFVISPAPLVGYGLMELGQLAKAALQDPARANAEEWVFHLPAQQSLLARLAHIGRRGTTLKGLQGRRTRVVLLSGDVHFGYTARLQYWGERPYGHATASPVDMVIAQVVASAFKNESSDSGPLHVDGTAGHDGPSADRFQPGPDYIAEGLGWSNDTGADVQVGSRTQPFGPAVPVRISGRNQVRFSSPGSNQAITAVTVPPDFVFRANWEPDPRFFTLDKPGEKPVDELEELRVDFDFADPDGAAVKQLDDEIAARKARIAGAAIVGRNQLGEITVKYRNGEPDTVSHIIYWRELRVADEAASGLISPLIPLTYTTVSLAFDAVPRPFG